MARVDRLTLDESGASETLNELDHELPEEELLRLDDGTILPHALAELRALLQLHQASSSEPVLFDEAASTDNPECTARLAALAEAKAEALQDLLLGFDEGILLLHDKLLDHEALCRRLDLLRRQQRATPARPAAAYDEACCFDDDDDDDESALELGDLLKLDGPAGVDSGSGGNGSGLTLESGAADGGEEDEEALDQRVAASRQQIKTWLRALEQGKREPAARMGMAASGLADRHAGMSPPAATAMTAAALPPVRPPPRARQSSYSVRLRSTTHQWGAKYS